MPSNLPPGVTDKDISPPEIPACPLCHGDGQTEFTDPVELVTDYKRCPRCLGSGNSED